jgi:hypothetical protein
MRLWIKRGETPCMPANSSMLLAWPVVICSYQQRARAMALRIAFRLASVVRLVSPTTRRTARPCRTWRKGAFDHYDWRKASGRHSAAENLVDHCRHSKATLVRNAVIPHYHPLEVSRWIDKMVTQSSSALAKAKRTVAGHMSSPVFRRTEEDILILNGLGRNLTVNLQVIEPITEAVLWYRHVTHAERWLSKPMERSGQAFSGTIPGMYTQSPFPLQYYFELRSKTDAAFYPPLNATLSNQPLFCRLSSDIGCLFELFANLRDPLRLTDSSRHCVEFKCTREQTTRIRRFYVSPRSSDRKSHRRAYRPHREAGVRQASW